MEVTFSVACDVGLADISTKLLFFIIFVWVVNFWDTTLQISRGYFPVLFFDKFQSTSTLKDLCGHNSVLIRLENPLRVKQRSCLITLCSFFIVLLDFMTIRFSFYLVDCHKSRPSQQWLLGNCKKIISVFSPNLSMNVSRYNT